MSLDQQRKLEQQFVMPTFARKPVEFVRGNGMYLEDASGNRYLDFLAGIGCVSLGHCHPAVVNAVREQAERLIHVGNYFYIEKRGQVAQKLSEALNAATYRRDPVAWKSFFANSGAEANECAIKIARLHAKKAYEEQGKDPESAPSLIVTLVKSFHGRTLATLAATAQPSLQAGFEPIPQGFLPTPINDVAALEALFDRFKHSICAVMLEPVQGESGVNPCTTEFIQAARRLTEKHEALLICDEVQTGMYRTGKPFAFQHADIMPDVVTIAKGVASGVPAAACAARGQVGETLQPGTHGSTFGGSNIVMSAAFATLTELEKPEIAENVVQTGEYLQEKLQQIRGVQQVRGIGLMRAADLTDEHIAPKVVDKALERGLVINATGPHTLRFLPPLICEKKHVDEFAQKLQETLSAN